METGGARSRPGLAAGPAAPLAWAAVAALFGAAAAPLDPNLLEEGVVVHTAERMLGGEHLYRDILIHTAPLPYELLALLFDAFGARLEVARFGVVVLQALAAALLFASARRAGVGALAHPAAAAVAVAPVLLVPLMSTWFYTTLAFYLAIAAVYVALRGTESTGWAVATGALVGAIALCKQSTGVFLAVGLLPGLWVGSPPQARLARSLGYAAGGLGLAAATLALYAARGDLGDMLFAQIELPRRLVAEQAFGTPLINFWPPGRLAPTIQQSWVMYLPSLYHIRYGLFAVIGSGAILLTQLLYLLPLAALAATAVRLLPVFPAPHAVVWLHGAALLALTLNLYPRADWGHLVVALPPAVSQLLLLPARRSGALAAGRALRAVAACALLALLAGGAWAGTWLHSIATEPRFGPRVPLRAVSRAYRSPALPRVIAYLRQHTEPGDAIYVPRQEPLLYFATQTKNPTPFVGVLPGLPELQEPTILEALGDVRFVVMSDIDQPIYTYYSDELPRVWAHLERHFRVAEGYPLDDFSWLVVLEPGPDRGETAVDLIAERARARAWLRDRRGRTRETSEAPQRLASRLNHRPLPVVLGALGGGLDFEVEVPGHAVFLAGVGYRGLVSVDHQYIHPKGTTLAVSIARAGSAAFEELAALRIDDSPRGGRRWTPVEVDLSDYAGERVTLRLEVKAKRPIRGDRLAWWGSPRIAVRAP